MSAAPWWAVLVVVVPATLISGAAVLLRAVWPQNSIHRKELWQEWQRERARRRKEVERRRQLPPS
ncbi:hypothetical protein [Kitasatospora griseola]|uniref:hypothetical protein n=1 Tax=Kitasatospora griseola TaxID=2064 RepID=UPI0036503457